jgi:hypothetical protein
LGEKEKKRGRKRRRRRTMVRIAPPPIPCTERPPITIDMLCAAPTSADPSAKSARAPSMTGRRPKMAASPPAVEEEESVREEGEKTENGDALQGMRAVEVRA